MCCQVTLRLVSLICLLIGLELPDVRPTYIRYRRCSKKYICIALSQCPRQSRVLHRATDFVAAMEHFNKHLCGLHDGVIDVCCHESFSLIKIGVGVPSDSSDENEVDASFNNASIIRHPNLRMINQHECGVGIKNRIVGGEKTIPGEFPWLALLQYQLGDGRLEFRCGGSLISDRYVLTAAHCVLIDDFSKELVSVRLGEHDVTSRLDCAMNGVEDEEGVMVCASQSPRDYRISQIVRHPRFERSLLATNDIALVRLREAVLVVPHFVVPVCLPTKNLLEDDEDDTTKRLVTAGWGITEKEHTLQSDLLLKTSVSHVESDLCAQRLDQQLLSSHVCAGASHYPHAAAILCEADSGGPLVTTLGNNVNTRINYQLGIASLASGRCDAWTPTVYTRVDVYIRWILDNMED